MPYLLVTRLPPSSIVFRLVKWTALKNSSPHEVLLTFRHFFEENLSQFCCKNDLTECTLVIDHKTNQNTVDSPFCTRAVVVVNLIIQLLSSGQPPAMIIGQDTIRYGIAFVSQEIELS